MHRRETDLRFVVAQDAMHIFCTQVFARVVEEDLQHNLALRRHLVLAFLQFPF